MGRVNNMQMDHDETAVHEMDKLRARIVELERDKAEARAAAFDEAAAYMKLVADDRAAQISGGRIISDGQARVCREIRGLFEVGRERFCMAAAQARAAATGGGDEG